MNANVSIEIEQSINRRDLIMVEGDLPKDEPLTSEEVFYEDKTPEEVNEMIRQNDEVMKAYEKEWIKKKQDD